MGASLGSQDKGSVNVELNIIPFIDLMSCLTAFLLVTAVWVNISSLPTEVAGKMRNEGPKDEDPPKVAILIEEDQISVSQYPTGDTRTVHGYDWARVEAALREFKTAGDQPQVEVAAASTDSHPIAYRHLVTAMDTAVKVGFPRVGVTEPSSLTR
jgi:biopolymer transport protein ExbD